MTRAAVRRGRRRRRFRGNRCRDPAQAAGFRQFRHPRPRGRPRRHLARQPLPGPGGRRAHHHATPTGSSRIRTGRGCSRPARRSSGTPTTSPTSTTSVATCGSTPTSKAHSWDEEAKVWRVALAGGETLTHALPDHRDRLPVAAAHARHPGHHRLRRQGHPHHRLGRQLRPRRPPDRDHRHRRHRGAADPRAGQEGRRPHRLPAHPDLGGAEVRPADSPHRSSGSSPRCR